MATKDFIGYQQLVDKAFRGVLRDALAHAARGGIMGSHHFAISFLTHAPGVQLSGAQREKYPHEMTIVLEHQYWGLKIHDDAFEVGLSFQKMPETLIIPFAAVTQFVDPSQNFGFKFQTAAEPARHGPPLVKDETPPPAKAAAEPKPEPKRAASEEPGAVVSLDKFRKK